MSADRDESKCNTVMSARVSAVLDCSHGRDSSQRASSFSPKSCIITRLALHSFRLRGSSQVALSPSLQFSGASVT